MTTKAMSAKRMDRRRSNGLVTRTNRWGYIFIIPTLLVLLVFRFVPMIAAGVLSFTQYDLFSPPSFYGFNNYIEIFSDYVFLQSLKASASYVAGSVIPVWGLSLLLGLLTTKVMRGSDIFRTVIFIPVVLAPVVVAVLWRFLYFENGMINTMLGSIGLPSVAWLTKPGMAMISVIHIGIWRATPYFMVIFTAGIQAIPQTYYEAGKIDGTNAWKEFWYITVPILKPIILLVVVMSVITALKVFAVPQLMTGGGPAGATEVLPLHIYKTGFEFFKMGKASAMSMILFLIMMVFSLIQIRLFSESD